ACKGLSALDNRAQLAPTVERAVKPVFLSALDGAVEGDPGHHLGIGEVPPAAAHLPNAFVGLRPRGFKVFQKGDLHPPTAVALTETAAASLMQRIHYLAVDVELELVVRAIADAHRSRIAKSLQPRHLPLDEPPLAGD